MQNEYELKFGIGQVSNDIAMKIILTHQQPITLRPRRLSFYEQEKLKPVLDNLLANDVI
jgi:hypothetical protein